jgi:pimeloyl-ACP methyl ester carboxylesterase
MATAEFLRAQRRMLDRHVPGATTTAVHTDSIQGDASVIAAGDGPPIVLLIGGGVPAAMWAPLMAELDGFRMYAVDLPGHGASAPGPYRTKDLRKLGTRFVLDVFDGLGLERPPLVAQSIGGLFALWTMLDHPDRVACASLVGCPAGLLGTSAPLPMRLMSLPSIGRFVNRIQQPSEKLAMRFGAMAGEDFTELPELRDLVMELLATPGFGDQLVDLIHGVVRLRGAQPDVEVGPEDLAHVRHRVQLIWGERDTFGHHSVGRRAAQLLPDAEFHLVAGGHAPWLDEPDRVAGIVSQMMTSIHG